MWAQVLSSESQSSLNPGATPQIFIGNCNRNITQRHTYALGLRSPVEKLLASQRNLTDDTLGIHGRLHSTCKRAVVEEDVEDDTNPTLPRFPALFHPSINYDQALIPTLLCLSLLQTKCSIEAGINSSWKIILSCYYDFPLLALLALLLLLLWPRSWKHVKSMADELHHFPFYDAELFGPKFFKWDAFLLAEITILWICFLLENPIIKSMQISSIHVSLVQSLSLCLWRI